MDKVPEVTIQDVIDSQEFINFACDGKIYDEDTLRKWLKPVSFNRDRGRRPKKNLEIIVKYEEDSND